MKNPSCSKSSQAQSPPAPPPLTHLQDQQLLTKEPSISRSGDEIELTEQCNMSTQEYSVSNGAILTQTDPSSFDSKTMAMNEIQALKDNREEQEQTNHMKNQDDFDDVEAVNDASGNNYDDDDAFIAYCADTSSVLNSHDLTRCYINKLYKPLNRAENTACSNNGDVPLVEHDDEYLLYEELKLIESSANKLAIERGQQVQLTTLLEDDEGDDVHDLDQSCHDPMEDPLDRLQLTTIIESFDDDFAPTLSAHSMIDSCHLNQHQNLLINDEACRAYEKPDSTGHTNYSPGSDFSSAGCESENNPDHLNSLSDQPMSCNHSSNHEIDGARLDLGVQGQENNYLAPIHNNTNNSAKFHHNHPYQNHHYNRGSIFQDQQRHSYERDSVYNNQDNFSETDCFQVSSTLRLTDTTNNEPVTVRQHESPMWETTHLLEDPNELCSSRQSKKRHLQDDNQNSCETMKKKKSNDEDFNLNWSENDEAKDIPTNRNESQVVENGVVPSISSRFAMTNEYQEKHIEATNDDSFRLIEDSNMGSITDDDAGTDISTSNKNSRRDPVVRKYRRRTANARERIRMREINQAFEKLKKVVPVDLIQEITSASGNGYESDRVSVSGSTTGNKRSGSKAESTKLTKITTLKLAVTYIAKLTEVLNQHSAPTTDLINIENSRASVVEQQRVTTGSILVDASAKPQDDLAKRKKRCRRRGSNTDSNGRKNATNSSSEAPKTDKNNKLVNVVGEKSDTGQQLNTKRQQLLTNDRQNIQPTIQQQQPIFITNINRNLSNQTAFVTIPQQCANMQQFATFSNNQQPFFIAQPTGAGQERAFVTPVAVAILGIPNNNRQTSSDTPQGVQLIGLQQNHHLMQQLQGANKFQKNTTMQMTPQQLFHGLQIATTHTQPQPQQVTLTLDDVDGVSVLRLANANQHVGNSMKPQVQFQAANNSQPNHDRQSQVIMGPTKFNYAYPSVQLTQHNNNLQYSSSSNAASVRCGQSTTVSLQQAQSGGIQIHHHLSNNINYNNNNNNLISINNATSINGSNNNQNKILDKSTTITGTSDCKSLKLNLSAQHSKNDMAPNYQLTQQQQQQLQQPNHHPTILLPNRQGQIILQPSSNSVTLTRPNELFTLRNNDQTQVQDKQQTNPQVSRVQESESSTDRTKQNVSVGFNPKANLTSANIDQRKFVTHFSSGQNSAKETKTGHNLNEANINQLVANLVTSIHPASSTANQAKASLNQIQAPTGNKIDSQVRQQPQRTYRFHNYDGNMITNYMYGNNSQNNNHHHNNIQTGNQDKPNQPKRSNSQQQQQVQQQSITTASGGGQRSRQNSISSICSSTSLVSSASSASQSASPANLPVASIMVKSPTGYESSSSSSCSSSSGKNVSSPDVILIDELNHDRHHAIVGGS